MQQSTALFLLICISFYSTAQNKGTFRISTNPQYANISLDGFPDIQKKSPAEFRYYRSLTYHVKISKRNYYDLDTLITCFADSITEYIFDLTPKNGSLSITTIPEKAQVYFNDQPLGLSPLNQIPISCGAHTIKIESPGYDAFSHTYIINEDMPLSIMHDFTQEASINNLNHSSPVDTNPQLTPNITHSLDDTSTPHNEDQHKNISNKNGFGTVGFFSMIGSNGAPGTSYRYGADIMHFFRIYGENNATSNIQGFGLDVILSADLELFALYGKVGAIARTFEDSYSQNITTRFITFGAGFSIKPSPHFQIFGEFEIDLYDEEQHPDDRQAWKDQFPQFSATTGWLGIRLAF